MSPPSFDPKIEVRDLGATIEKALGSLTLLFHKLESSFDLPRHMTGIHQAIISGAINAETIEQEQDNRIFQRETLAPYKSHFRHACIYTELAKISYAERNENSAWSFIAQANYQIGLAIGTFSTYQGVDIKDARSMQTKEAARVRHSKTDPERREIIRLLSDPPTGGWKDEKEALNNIIGPLNNIIQQSLKSLNGHRFEMTEPNHLKSSVKRWLQYDKKKAEKGKPQSMIRLTYEAHSQERLTNPNNH
ncbi:MAG: hypothetical protein E6Q71_00215 [Pseudomonas sp.]|nr:MAG: hypothetical protein E6Q71_00215 [Pseudomonas sp.]